jgi:hypothetical protein
MVNKHLVVGKPREHLKNIRGTFLLAVKQVVYKHLVVGKPREHLKNIRGTFLLAVKQVVYKHLVVGKSREHLENIRGAGSDLLSKEHSWSNHGTFMEHSLVDWQWSSIRVELKQAPVSHPPNCKKHFTKIPR